MSTILFRCESNKDELKIGVWKILHEYYLSTVFPNTNVKYKNEGKEIYSNRLDELMKEELCNIEETEDGIKVEFDSTEDAGFLIASNVYGTNMGYSDNGLTFLKPLFDAFIMKFPSIAFEGYCECYDNWVSEEYECSYDGEHFECSAEWEDDFE